MLPVHLENTLSVMIVFQIGLKGEAGATGTPGMRGDKGDIVGLCSCAFKQRSHQFSRRRVHQALVKKANEETRAQLEKQVALELLVESACRDLQYVRLMTMVLRSLTAFSFRGLKDPPDNQDQPAKKESKASLESGKVA